MEGCCGLAKFTALENKSFGKKVWGESVTLTRTSFYSFNKEDIVQGLGSNNPCREQRKFICNHSLLLTGEYTNERSPDSWKPLLEMPQGISKISDKFSFLFASIQQVDLGATLVFRSSAALLVINCMKHIFSHLAISITGQTLWIWNIPRSPKQNLFWSSLIKMIQYFVCSWFRRILSQVNKLWEKNCFYLSLLSVLVIFQVD